MAKTGPSKSKVSAEPAKPAVKPRKRKQEESSASRENGLTVVGIGASAGGLRALQSLFGALPNDTGMAFVVITHLHPEHESHLAELLQSHTKMIVQQVNEMVDVHPNHVYVIPPNREISMADSRLGLKEFEEQRGQRTPIDHFFRSLAASQHDAIGIILSGGGTDGSVGIKAIKEQGGVLMVQSPEEAEYDSMPRAAIATGLADIVLGVRELAEKLAVHTRNVPQVPRDAESLNEQQLETIQRILAQVYARTGHDFSEYKRSTILRRIQRRMQLNGYTTLEAYLGYLRHKGSEARAMFNDILIGVTNFFRDHQSWERLAEDVIPSILESKNAGDIVRVWTIGCASGEEAYTLAILFAEQVSALDIRTQFQIFASDLDDESIRRARLGIYPTAIEADVSPDRLERFFVQDGNHYQVRRELRDMVLFTNHNVLRDPPFSRLDLIACRNLFIYLQREIQGNVFDIFHYALNPGGYLFLGSSESAEAVPELFQTLDKTHRIFRAKPWNRDQKHIPSLPLSTRYPAHPNANTPPHVPRIKLADEASLPVDQHQRALEAHAPPSILINEQYAILHISETAGRYLMQQKGTISSDLFRLVRAELKVELRTALFRAFEMEKAVMTQPVPVQFNGHPSRVFVAVYPHIRSVEDGKRQEKQALVVFLEDPDGASTLAGAAQTPETRDQAQSHVLVAQLEAEVRRLREQLQISVEEHESSNEELKASNEELQSINEEYRSATEELETSKEELQSLNEELQTVNNELKDRLEEISRSHIDLENLMSATEVGTLFLDRELCIRHYTPAMQELFNIRPGDRGRPIRHLTHKLQYTEFIEDAEQVLHTLAGMEREVRGEKGEWFLLRMRPYRTVDDRIDGVIFTFVDITRMKDAEHALVEERVEARTSELDEANKRLSETRDMFQGLFRYNPTSTTLNRLDDGVFMDVNEAFLKFFGIERQALIGHDPLELDLLPLQEHATLLARMKDQGEIRNVEAWVRTASGEVKTVLVSSHRLKVDDTDVMLSAFIDITAQKQMEENLRVMLDAAPDPTIIVDETGKVVRVNAQLEKVFGYSRVELVGQSVEKLIPERFHESHPLRRTQFMGAPNARSTGGVNALNVYALRRDGTEFPVEISLSPLETQEGVRIIASIRDATEQHTAERRIRALATRLTGAEQAERHRISQVLHDDLQQRLFAVKAEISSLNDRFKDQDWDGLQAAFSDIDQWLSESIHITRNLSVNISPIILHGEGLANAIAWLSTQMQRQYALDVTLNADGVRTNFDDSLRVMLFQSIRELLFNVVKHAETSQAVVTMEQVDNRIRITVSDEGRGFDTEAVMNDANVAHGLLSIHQRLDLLGCKMEVFSKPGAGTRVCIDCPLPGE